MTKWNWLWLLFLPYTLAVSAAPATVVPMVKYDAQTYYVNVTIGDAVSEEFVIDTGASHVTISDSTLKKLLANNQATFVRAMTGVLADGTNIDVPVYRIDHLKIGNQCSFHDIEVAVMQGNARCVLIQAIYTAMPCG